MPNTNACFHFRIAVALLSITTFCNSLLSIATTKRSRYYPRIISSSSPSLPSQQSTSSSSSITLSLSSNNNKDNDTNINNSQFDMIELSQRINNLKESNRIEESVDNNMVNDDREGSGSGIINLPVISFDCLLPKQRLVGSTTDPTFCRFLRDVGLGGLFVMISINYKQRKLKRNGVIVKITIVDAKKKNNQDNNNNVIIPTSVDFELVGRRRCRVLGPSEGMKARVGRWRRSYDPDGEESRLGWGEEKFVDYIDDYHQHNDDLVNTIKNNNNNTCDENLSYVEWNKNKIDCSFNDDAIDAIAISNDDSIIPLAKSIIPLLDKWYNLASNIKTYENINVVATTRAVHGYPQLRVNPKKLLQTIKLELGECPTPEKSPTKFVLWCAAFINPVPVPLGVSPELRGRVLEASNVKRKLEILKWGIERSILNLNGTLPLC